MDSIWLEPWRHADYVNVFSRDAPIQPLRSDESFIEETHYHWKEIYDSIRVEKEPGNESTTDRDADCNLHLGRS